MTTLYTALAVNYRLWARLARERGDWRAAGTFERKAKMMEAKG